MRSLGFGEAVLMCRELRALRERCPCNQTILKLCPAFKEKQAQYQQDHPEAWLDFRKCPYFISYQSHKPRECKNHPDYCLAQKTLAFYCTKLIKIELPESDEARSGQIGSDTETDTGSDTSTDSDTEDEKQNYWNKGKTHTKKVKKKYKRVYEWVGELPAGCERPDIADSPDELLQAVRRSLNPSLQDPIVNGEIHPIQLTTPLEDSVVLSQLQDPSYLENFPDFQRFPGLQTALDLAGVPDISRLDLLPPRL